MQKRLEKCTSGTFSLWRGREGVGEGVAQRRQMAVEHATQVFAMDQLPGNEQEFKQTGVLCLRFQALSFLAG